jgi:multidrug resistance efflux pump
MLGVIRVLGVVVVMGGLLAALFLSQREEGALQVSGFVEADQIRVGSRVGGRVLAVHVEEGDRVKQGQLLLELEPYDLLERRAEAAAELERRQAEALRLEAGFRPEEIAQAEAVRARLAARLDELEKGPRPQEIDAAEARVREAEATLDLARTEHERALRLSAAGTAPAEEVERAQSALKVAGERRNARGQELALLKEGTRAEVTAQAKAQLAEAEAALALVRKGYREEDKAQARAAVAAAEAALRAFDGRVAELKVFAPVDGIIEALRLRKGDLLPPDAPALTLLDPARLWVRAYVPEARLSFATGAKVKVRVDAQQGREFAGEITFVAGEAEFLPGNVQTPEERSKQVFRIKVDLREGLDVLRPGMPADVLFP